MSVVLISEDMSRDVICESKDKDLYITGIFMQSNVPNQNNRIYPKEILQRECARYNEEKISKNRATGELDHPASPSINLERASHLIVSLKESGNDFIGRAKILQTPCGNIARGLIEGGVNLGVSTRGTGSMTENSMGSNIIGENYTLRTVDIVSDPSAASAFVNGIMEGVEWIYENGMFTSKQLEESKKQLDNCGNKSKQISLEIFENLMAHWSV